MCRHRVAVLSVRVCVCYQKPDVKHQYVKQIQCKLLQVSQKQVKVLTIKAYRKQHPDLFLSRVVCKIAAKRVLNNALHMHKNHLYDCFALAKLS